MVDGGSVKYILYVCVCLCMKISVMWYISYIIMCLCGISHI